MTNLSSMYYRQGPKEALVAMLAVNPEQPRLADTTATDTSQYEFPGDRTYERYLSNRSGV